MIFSHKWPIDPDLLADLIQATENGYDDWVVIPLPGVSFESLRRDVETFSMGLQESVLDY